MNISKLSKLSKNFKKKYKEKIKDIILFGSIVRGKKEPEDTDVLLLFYKKINKDIEYEFKKKASIENISLISKTEETLYDPSFSARESILYEGLSLVERKQISSKFGFDSMGVFIYHTQNLKNTEKTKFYYALNGRRGSSGMAESLNVIKLSDNIIAVPLEKVEEAKDFFKQQGVEFTYVPSLIPSRMAKRHIIGKGYCA